MKKTIFHLCAWVFLFVVNFVNATVVEGPFTNVINGHAYYLITPNSWSNAEAEAESMGGHLATIRSDSENNWLTYTFLADFRSSGGPNLTNLPVWIGLYDPMKSDGGQHATDFVWALGETNTYRHWQSGQPDNANNVEYYTCINWFFAAGSSSDHSTWNDAAANGSTGYGGTSDGPYYGIVEMGTGIGTPPTNTPGTVLGPIISPLNGHQYFIVPSNSWAEAEAEAEALGGTLTTVRSAAESQWLIANVLVDLTPYDGTNLTKLPLWLGIYDPANNDGAQHTADFVWVSGETNSYSNWNSGQPDNHNSVEYYGCINWFVAQGITGDHSLWNDAPLNGTTGFGGMTDGPYYGIAEVAGAGILQIGLTNSIITITPVPNNVGTVIQSAAGLQPPIQWTPVWTNDGVTPFTTAIGSGNRFFRLTQ